MIFLKKYHNWGGLILILSVSLGYVLLTGFVIWGLLNDFYEAKGWLAFEILTIWLAIALVIHHYRRMARKIAAKNAFETLSEQSTDAKAVTKNTRTVGNRYSTGTNYYITFETPDGERINFQVNQDIYSIIEKDDFGLLTYKEGDGYRFFVDFKRKKVV